MSDVLRDMVVPTIAACSGRVVKKTGDGALLEFCSVVGALLIDADGIYDPAQMNDRLLLGMKGTISEMELASFRQRAHEAMKQKAKRGELFMGVPIGYVRTFDDRLEKDPDERVRAAIDLVFRKFAEFGSARRVYLAG